MPLIRFAFLADAIATAATGLLLAFGGGLLAGLTGIPADVSMPLGIFLVVFAAFVGWVGTRRPVPRGLALLVVGVNALWVVGSVALLVAGALPLTMLGIAFVIAQAVAVAALAILQWVAIGRTRALA